VSELHAYRVSVHGDLYQNAERKEGSGCESGQELIAHSGLSTDRDQHPETTERRRKKWKQRKYPKPWLGQLLTGGQRELMEQPDITIAVETLPALWPALWLIL
jgi:hypothetical protein